MTDTAEQVHDSGGRRLDVRKGFSLEWTSYEQLDLQLPLIAAAGFDGVEPTFNPGAVPSPENYSAQAAELKRRCEGTGLEIPSMRGGRAPWGTIPSPEPAERASALEHTRRALDCLKIMGGRVLLVVPGEIRPDVRYEDHWKRVVEYARQAAEIAEKFDAVIGFENVEARFPLSVREWTDLMREIAHPRIRVYLDVGNVTWLGSGFPQQWIESLGQWICQIHFKDAHFAGSLRNLLAGEVEWPAVVSALRRIGYSGWISVEPLWYRHAPGRLAERLSRDLDAILAL